jgi:hypothetical protein
MKLTWRMKQILVAAVRHPAHRVTVCTDRVTICVNINCRHDGQEISFTI